LSILLSAFRSVRLLAMSQPYHEQALAVILFLGSNARQDTTTPEFFCQIY
jgi:hypothetical protein